ncbi:MAG: protein phosphatase 2C domain-containing protein [Gemmatimonadaceae bacterium]
MSGGKDRAPERKNGVPPRVVVEAFAQSDVGLTREHNEDSFIVAYLSDGQPLQFEGVLSRPADTNGTIFMVADGMGGAAAGELASATAVDVVLRYLREHWKGSEGGDPADFVRSLAEATEVANAAIFQYAHEHVELRGMGTTATIVGLLGDTLYLVQVGDSRAYLVRDGIAFQLTKDQSLMQKLIEAGEISEHEAEFNERRNIILQALGPEAHVRVDLTHQSVRRGDVLLLCSDGLTGLVKPDVIARAVREEKDLSRVCSRLIGTANDMGGPDNITVVAARFDGDGLQPATAVDEVKHVHFPLEGHVGPAEYLLTSDPVTTPDIFPSDLFPVVDEARRRRGEMYVRILAGLGLLAVLYAAWVFFPSR